LRLQIPKQLNAFFNKHNLWEKVIAVHVHVKVIFTPCPPTYSNNNAVFTKVIFLSLKVV
jgi:hypothetical protein